MQISAINTYNQVHTVNKLATSSTENSTEITGLELPNYNQSVAFMGTRLIAFRKPVIIEENSKAVYQKVQRIFEKLPNGAKMSKPILFEVNGKKYGFTWDKSECDRLKLVIKDKAERLSFKEYPLNFLFCLLDSIEPVKKFEGHGFSARDVLQMVSITAENNDAEKCKINIEWDSRLKEVIAKEEWEQKLHKLEEWLDVCVEQVDKKISISFEK